MQTPIAAPEPKPDDVVAAAIAASAWVRRRRDVWAGDGPALPPLRIAVPVAPVRPVESISPEIPPASEPVKPRRLAIDIARASSVVRTLADVAIAWWKPAAVTVAIVALAAGVVFGARAGWRYATVTLGAGWVFRRRDTCCARRSPSGGPSGARPDGTTLTRPAPGRGLLLRTMSAN